MEDRMPNGKLMLEIADPDTDARRIIKVDLDDEDEWGDIEVGKNPWNETWAEVGGEVEGRWRVVRAFRRVPAQAGLHTDRFEMADEISMSELYDAVMARFDKFSN